MLAIEFQHLRQILAAFGARIDLEAPGFQRLQEFPMGLRLGIDLAPGIGKEAQRPLGGDGRIELAHRPGGGIARIGESLLALLLLPLVQRQELLPLHEDLAAHFEHRRQPCPSACAECP